MANTVRVAAVQFHVGHELEVNLATCLRMIDQAAGEKPDLIVLPEFCNYLSWYEDRAHCFNVSVTLDGEFLTAVSAKAREHSCYIVVNVTLQRADGAATGTSLAYDPNGRLVGSSDKQVLIGHENDFLARAQSAAPLIETPFGLMGTYACMDGVINETPRGLALRGAQILGNSLNSFARDEAALHVPVRAAENRVFVVAANKVGSLIPEFLREPVSQATNIPMEFLDGAGESQIVAPDGTVLAKGPRDREAVVVADIDPTLANNKQRPDGTDVFASRRPELYTEIGQNPAGRTFTPGKLALETAVYQPKLDGSDAIAEVVDAVTMAAQEGVQLIVLPELFCFAGGVVSDGATAVSTSQQVIQALAAALKSVGVRSHVVTSLVLAGEDGPQHCGVLIGAEGLEWQQPQLHRSQRHAGWNRQLGDGLGVIELDWGKLTIVVGDDALYPETFRLAVFQDADVVAVPLHVQEKWETELGLVERSAENRLCLVAATRPGAAGTSLITTLQQDFTLMTPWETRQFDGILSHPLVTRATAEPGLTWATVHPQFTDNKVASANTDLVNGRPWHLAEAITQANR